MGHSYYRYRRSGESKPKSVQGCFVATDLSAHNLVSVKKAEGYSLADSIVPHHLCPQELAGSANFSISLQKMMPTNTVSESLLTKRAKHPGPKCPAFSISLLHIPCNTNKAYEEKAY